MARRRTTAPRRPLRGRISPPRALWLVLLSIGLVAAQLLATGHLVFVSHAICAHGALLHDASSDGTGHAQAGAPADPGEAPSAAPGHAGAEHEHCNPLGLRHAVVSVQPACVVPEVLATGLVSWGTGPAFAERPISILALAPKSSPPRLPSFPS